MTYCESIMSEYFSNALSIFEGEHAAELFTLNYKKELLILGQHCFNFLLSGPGWVRIKRYALAVLEETGEEGKPFVEFKKALGV